MDTTKLIKQIEKLPGGRFFRLRYISQLPVKDKYKKEGVSIMKITETTTRTGINYKSIPSVLANLTNNPIKDSNFEWVIKNKIKYNTNTKKYYFVVAPIKQGRNTKTTYIVIDKEGTYCRELTDELKEMVIESYWSKPLRPINTISLENVLMIR